MNVEKVREKMIVGEDGYSIYQRKNAIVIGLPDRWDDRWSEKLTDSELCELLDRAKELFESPNQGK